MTGEELADEIRGVLGTVKTQGRCVLNVSDVQWLTALLAIVSERSAAGKTSEPPK